MKSYIQYKQFNSVDELNKWLEDFYSTERGDGKNEPFTSYNSDSMSMRTLMNIQFLQEASVNGDNDKVNGSIHVYPIAQFKITVLG